MVNTIIDNEDVATILHAMDEGFVRNVARKDAKQLTKDFKLHRWCGTMACPAGKDRIPAFPIDMRLYFVGITVRCFTLPVFETEAVNVNSSPPLSLMTAEDSPLISTSSGEVQRALVKVGSTILPTLFKDALKASAILGLKTESRSS